MLQIPHNPKRNRSNPVSTIRSSNKEHKIKKESNEDPEIKKNSLQNLQRIKESQEQNQGLTINSNINGTNSSLFKRSLSQLKKSDLFSSAELQATNNSNYISILPSGSSNNEEASSPTLVQKRLKAMNQFITGISRRYIQRINLLQNFQRASKEKIHELTEKIQGLEEMNGKLLRECEFRKERNQIIENQLNIISFKIKQVQAKNRQNQFVIESKSYENRSLSLQNQNLKKKNQSVESQYQIKIQELNSRLINSQRDREKIQLQVRRGCQMHQDSMQRLMTELKESKQKHNVQKEHLEKQLRKLTKKLDEKHQMTRLYQSQERQLKKSLEIQKQQDYKLKAELVILTNQLASLKQSVIQTQKQLQSAELQIKILNPLKQQIKGLKSNIEEKDQLIAILRQKIISLQNLLALYQFKINDNEQHIQNLAQGYKQLQQQKKQLRQQIQIQKQSMGKLISQLQINERNAEVLQQQLGSKLIIYEEQGQLLKQANQRIIQQNNILKNEKEQMEKQWSEQVQKYKSMSMIASNLKSKNELLQSEVFKLNKEKMSISQQYFKLQNEASQLDNEKNTLVSQIVELKSQKSMKQSQYGDQVHEYSKISFKKTKQLDELAEQVSKLKQSTKQLANDNQQKYHELIDKQKQIQQLHDQLFQLREEKFKIQSQLQFIKIPSSHRQYMVKELEQELQQLRQYIEILQMHINELDNVLVWDLEYGQGQTNNFGDRRIKIQTIVKKLHAEEKANIELKKSNKQKQERIEQLGNKNEQYKDIIEKYSETIKNFLEDKEALKNMIEEIQQSNKILVQKLQNSKQSETALITSERNLTKNAKYKQRMISKLQNDNKQYKQKLEEREKDNSALRGQVRQLRQKNRSYEQTIEKITQEKRHMDQDYKKKFKELTSKYDMSKRENQERKKALGSIENEKKAQIYALNSQVSNLKNQMKQLTIFYDGEKFNYLKRNLLLNDLGNNLTRLQKNNNIKGQYLLPLKEILKKLELFDSNSSKLFAKIGKLDVKKEGGGQY